MEIPGDWRFSGTPAIWDGLYFSAQGQAGDATLHFEDGTADAKILWDDSENRFDLNRDLRTDGDVTIGAF